MTTVGDGWRTDVLGEPYEAVDLALPDDSEGPVVATLVRRLATGPGGERAPRAVLHVHGFADYFFQTPAADHWVGRGDDFYALDLRKYGRSLRPHQTPNYVADLAEYHPEIEAAWRHVVEVDGHAEVLLSAHSTGGLTLPLWAHGRRVSDGAALPGLVGMVLNSPWLDMHGSTLVRTVGTLVVDRIGARFPMRVLPRSVNGFYAQSLHRDLRGEWPFDLAWKPEESWPVHLGWLRAIRRGHSAVHAGIEVGCPVLVLSSARSSLPDVYDDRVTSTDIVLDVAQIRRWSVALGAHVTAVSVEGALHDVTLSAAPVRERVFAEIDTWVDAYASRSRGRTQGRTD